MQFSRKVLDRSHLTCDGHSRSKHLIALVREAQRIFEYLFRNRHYYIILDQINEISATMRHTNATVKSKRRLQRHRNEVQLNASINESANNNNKAFLTTQISKTHTRNYTHSHARQFLGDSHMWVSTCNYNLQSRLWISKHVWKVQMFTIGFMHWSH